MREVIVVCLSVCLSVTLVPLAIEMLKKINGVHTLSRHYSADFKLMISGSLCSASYQGDAVGSHWPHPRP